MTKQFIFAVLLLFLLNISLFSQTSIHQIEYEAHRRIKKVLNKEMEQNIIPLKKTSKNLSHVIYGYLPDWEYQAARQYLRYDLLTHISAFDFVLDNKGNISLPSYWPWTDVINAAHANGVKIIMTAVNFEASYITALLTDTTIADNFINQAINIILLYDLDGVNIDFENVPTVNRGNDVNRFMLRLTNEIHSVLPDKEVSFAGPAVNWGGWDFRGLANSCDYIFIMGYDFYGSWSTNTGASAPLDPTAGSSISIRNTIETQYGAVTNNMPDKLILGVPYYGQRWSTVDSLPHSSIISYVSSTRFSTDAVNASLYGTLWATDNKTPWYRFRSGTTWHQVWFDNDSSLSLKYKLAIDKKFKGVGMWALGYDGARNELWNELKKNFYTEPSDYINPISNEFYINQNYPNPFNSQTVITYSLKEKSDISLTVYDILGREITCLVDANQAAGEYTIQFNANQFKLSSGIYYYIFKTDHNIIQTKKMVYLK